MTSLEGQVAIVTGGARGIGFAYASGLGAEGSAVVLVDLIDGSPAVDRLRDSGVDALAVTADVSDQTATERVVDLTLERYGRIDVLVNNAAWFRYIEKRPFTDIDVDEWDKAFAVNVRGSWLMSRAVYPAMRDASGGRIINVSSMTVWKGVPGFAHYVASKAAIIGLTRALAVEMGPAGVTVNTVVPDFIPHDIENQSDPAIDERNVRDRIFKRTQTPEDMVGIVVFLCGPGAAFITGQSFLVNGGARFQ
jgi:NAD(P)-dependent dehydrogenase (short-subunit alcohol dehydrogenase family)